MIEFTKEQESQILRRDCRIWTELVARSWYESDNPLAAGYPARELTQHLRAVYFACHDAGIDNLEYTSQLGFSVLRANTMACDPSDVEAIVAFFLRHAQSDNVDYAQNWIDLYLEGH
ncbi:MAG: hypothetical protein V4724_15795 [Pseudomonadota bacterium]